MARPPIKSAGPVIVNVPSAISLRDWFAGMAINGILRSAKYVDEESMNVAARDAYRIADGMLAESKKDASYYRYTDPERSASISGENSHADKSE